MRMISENSIQNPQSFRSDRKFGSPHLLKGLYGNVHSHQRPDRLPGRDSRALSDQPSAARRSRQADRPDDRHHHRHLVAVETSNRILSPVSGSSPYFTHSSRNPSRNPCFWTEESGKREIGFTTTLHWQPNQTGCVAIKNIDLESEKSK